MVRKSAPRPLKGGALGAGGESDTKENPRHSAQPKRLGGLWRGLSPLWRALARTLPGAAKGVAVLGARDRVSRVAAPPLTPARPSSCCRFLLLRVLILFPVGWLCAATGCRPRVF